MGIFDWFFKKKNDIKRVEKNETKNLKNDDLTSSVIKNVNDEVERQKEFLKQDLKPLGKKIIDGLDDETVNKLMDIVEHNTNKKKNDIKRVEKNETKNLKNDDLTSSVIKNVKDELERQKEREYQGLSSHQKNVERINMSKKNDLSPNSRVKIPNNFKLDNYLSKEEIKNTFQSLPSWFDGEVYDEGGNVFNESTNKSYYLNNKELSIYDGIIGTDYFIENNIDSGNKDVYVERIKQHLDWFKLNSSEKYNFLLKDFDKKYFENTSSEPIVYDQKMFEEENLKKYFPYQEKEDFIFRFEDEEILNLDMNYKYEFYFEFTEYFTGGNFQLKLINNLNSDVLSKWNEKYNEDGWGTFGYDNEKKFDPKQNVIENRDFEVKYLVKMSSDKFLISFQNLIKEFKSKNKNGNFNEFIDWLECSGSSFYMEICKKIGCNDMIFECLYDEVGVYNGVELLWYSHYELETEEYNFWCVKKTNQSKI